MFTLNTKKPEHDTAVMLVLYLTTMFVFESIIIFGSYARHIAQVLGGK
jgi:hypothetical protein